ncbi:hypothetical protein DICPUDRAFT_85613, partial [Dictyostelium purpureum]
HSFTNKNMCCHDQYDVKKLEERPIDFFPFVSLFNSDNDSFPDIGEGCTKACKEKMIKLSRLVLTNYMNALSWYYHDVKIGTDYEYSGHSSYICFIIDGYKYDPEYFDYTLEIKDNQIPDYEKVQQEKNKDKK